MISQNCMHTQHTVNMEVMHQQLL